MVKFISIFLLLFIISGFSYVPDADKNIGNKDQIYMQQLEFGEANKMLVLDILQTSGCFELKNEGDGNKVLNAIALPEGGHWCRNSCPETPCCVIEEEEEEEDQAP